MIRELAAPQLLCPHPLSDEEYALTIKMTSSQFPAERAKVGFPNMDKCDSSPLIAWYTTDMQRLLWRMIQAIQLYSFIYSKFQCWLYGHVTYVGV